MIFLLRIYHPHLFIRVRSLDVFLTGPVRISGRRVDGPSDSADAAPSRDFAPTVQSRDLDTVAAGSVPDPNMGVLSRGWRDALVGGSIRLLTTLECPEGSVLSCVDGVVASVGVAQTCEEACDWGCCIRPGAYDGFTVGVCWDSARWSKEGGYRDACIDGVFLGCKCSQGVK